MDFETDFREQFHLSYPSYLMNFFFFLSKHELLLQVKQIKTLVQKKFAETISFNVKAFWSF